MALIEVKVDAARTLALLRNGGKRMAFAVVNALNATAKEIQKGERAHAASAFNVRKREFFLREAAVITGESRLSGSGFASVKQGRYEVRIAVGDKKRLLLSQFESGGVRRPFRGKNLAVPVTGGRARPSASSSVQQPFTFAGMHLTSHYKGVKLTKRRRGGKADVGLFGEYGRVALPEAERSRIQWKGKNRTFLLPQSKNAPHGAVFVRTGPKRQDIRVVWIFQPTALIDRRLKFVETGKRIADQHFQRNLLAQVNATLSHNLGFGR